MRKYFLRYSIFWIPAVAVAYIFNDGSRMSIVPQWFFAFFMLFGWGVTSATASYRFPRATMSLILCYTGLNVLFATILYASSYGSPLHSFMRNYAGIFSYIPLRILVKALIDFNIQQEIAVTLIASACCMAGYIAGIVRRRVSPDPYQPRMG